MKATAVSGIQTGIMVMHDGDRRHGIDIPAIRRAVPDCLFRVGEGHFQDRSFERNADHAEEVGSIRAHMELIGNPEFCYSETTVFPPQCPFHGKFGKKSRIGDSGGHPADLLDERHLVDDRTLLGSAGGAAGDAGSAGGGIEISAKKEKDKTCLSPAFI